jgi:hypothetical protein
MAFPKGKCVIFEYQTTCLSHENGCVVLRNGLPLGQMGCFKRFLIIDSFSKTSILFISKMTFPF